MHLGMIAISSVPLAASGAVKGTIWIAGWIVVVGIIVGVPVYFTRRRRRRSSV